MNLNLPTAEQIAVMTPEDLKKLVDSLEGNKNELNRQVAIFETNMGHYTQQKEQAEKQLIEITGSAEPEKVQAFIQEQTNAASAALETLKALFAPPAQEQPAAQPAAPTANGPGLTAPLIMAMPTQPASMSPVTMNNPFGQ